MSAEFKDEVTTKIISFLREIGLSVSVGRVDEASFLPGIAIVDGGLVVDEPNLLYPGDLLHEAGHLALAPAELRGTLSGMVEIPGAIAEIVEVAAMCWSYAACLHLEIDPHVVFHDGGYYGRSAALLRNFELGVFIGVAPLEAAGLVLSPAAAQDAGLEPFPTMQKWLRD